MFKYTEHKLAKDIARVAESIEPPIEYAYLPETREVQLRSNGDDNPYTIFLGNIFLKISALPKNERLPAIEAFLREMLQPTELSPDELMASLSLRVRTAFEIIHREKMLEELGHDVPPSIVRQFGDLIVEVVSDREESVALAHKDELADIGVCEAQAVEMAAAALRRATDDQQWEQLGDRLWISRYQDDYDFARVVAGGTDARFPFDGQPIVFAPSHSICLVTDRASAETLTRMTEFGNGGAENHRPFCQWLWSVSGDGTWHEWAPDASSDAAEVARLQHLRERVSQYDEQKSYLESHIKEDVFIAGFQAIRNDDGLSCYCVYTLDLPTYLPQTDFVAIVDSELPEKQAVVGRVDWDEFADCVGPESLCRVEDLIPPVYRLAQPLSDDVKDRLREFAVEM